MRSCVTADKLYGVYDATEPALISEHATRGGFPCDSVEPVRGMISRGSAR